MHFVVNVSKKLRNLAQYFEEKHEHVYLLVTVSKKLRNLAQYF